jgi:hypothetical protein
MQGTNCMYALHHSYIRNKCYDNTNYGIKLLGLESLLCHLPALWFFVPQIVQLKYTYNVSILIIIYLIANMQYT